MDIEITLREIIALKKVSAFVEDWNKKDENKDVAEAVQVLDRIIEIYELTMCPNHYVEGHNCIMI